jgi:hypothetical protein
VARQQDRVVSRSHDIDATLPLSVVVVAYDIERELPRTLRSLSLDYQRGVTIDDYEVLIVDNGSPTPIDESVLEGLTGNFRIVQVDAASSSPVPAVNLGIREAHGEVIGVMLDGARLVTPGLLRMALVGSHVHERSAIVTLGWYLGADFQRNAIEAGWTKADEDRLLESVGWPTDGYRLFEIATMDESSVDGWFRKIAESNALFLPAKVWDELDGYDERFDAPGGGMANHDALVRALALDDVGWVVLLGEATFHQVHGGVATNASADAIEDATRSWNAQFEQIRGTAPVARSVPNPIYLGCVPSGLRPRLAHALNAMLHDHDRLFPEAVPPPFALPDPDGESDPMAKEWITAATNAAAGGRPTEALTFARWARNASPASPATEQLLSFLAVTTHVEDLPRAERVRFLIEAGEAYARAGDVDAAERRFREVLKLDPGNVDAYVGISQLRLPGPFYYSVLENLHEYLNPATYLEIGVSTGQSLTLARPPTVAVAVDPDPQLRFPINVECHLYRETSGEFFEGHDVRALFGGRAPELAFIDGLHHFPTVLEDFLNVEAISDPSTIVLFHDMIPFDEITQRAERVFDFYTGDVWKLLHCLADVRPDLSWFTVRTPPSGLTFVTGLDPASTVLRDQYEKLVARYDALPFEDSLHTPGQVLDNDWDLVAAQLREWQAAVLETPAPTITDSAATVAVAEPATATALARRVRELEGLEASRQRELEDLKWAARRSATLGWLMDPDSAYAELERLRATRLHRWTRPVRQAYSRLRFRRDIV